MRWAERLNLAQIGTRRAQATARAILLDLVASIAWNADAENYGEAWPTVAKIAERIGRKPRGVQYIMRRLESFGYVVRRERKRADGGNASNLYALNPAARRVENPAVCEGGGVHKPRSLCTP